jgi:biotin-dependent carboxylase-like uncharacterized protein
MPMIEILDVGLMATIQDLGRAGYGHLGVPTAGAMDAAALRMANRILGNPEGAAGIEMLLGRCAVRFLDAGTFCLAGAPPSAKLDGRPIAHASYQLANAGQVLAIGAAVFGTWTYLAVGGGVAVPAVMSSRSTDTLSGLGPAPLRAGARLSTGVADPLAAPFHDAPALAGGARAGERVQLEFYWGPREDRFTGRARELLCQHDWTVSQETDRTGTRLLGPALEFSDVRELASEALATGSIQVPPSGQPIIHLANHPTTGGYPVIGVLRHEHVGSLAQCPPGKVVNLRPVRNPLRRRLGEERGGQD